MKLTIFYSWQSTTDKSYNKNFIRKCINKSVANIEEKREIEGVHFVINESTSGLSGSPDIVSVIENRVNECDIFIGDLTVVHSNCINQNVLIEYGRACVKPGSECIIGVMNIVYGNPHDNPLVLPFDIRQKRFPILYKLNEDKDIFRTIRMQNY